MGNFLLQSVTTDFFSANLNLKNLDEERLSTYYRNELKLFRPGDFSSVFLPITNLFGQSSPLLSQVLLLGQKTIVLRR